MASITFPATMFFNRIPVLALLLASLPLAISNAEDKVWSAVVLASSVKQGEQAKPTPPELVPFARKLSKFFGYDQFEILGSAVKSIDEQSERWLVPTPNFWVRAKALRDGAGYRLNLEFFQDKRCLLETNARLAPNSPLFVRGPTHARGQLIMVFEIKP